MGGNGAKGGNGGNGGNANDASVWLKDPTGSFNGTTDTCTSPELTAGVGILTRRFGRWPRLRGPRRLQRRFGCRERQTGRTGLRASPARPERRHHDRQSRLHLTGPLMDGHTSGPRTRGSVGLSALGRYWLVVRVQDDGWIDVRRRVERSSPSDSCWIVGDCSVPARVPGVRRVLVRVSCGEQSWCSIGGRVSDHA